MGKKLTFLVLDTETASLPFANEIAQGDPDKKKKIAIARPLIYDIGWCLVHRDGTIIDKKNYLIAETFSVPAVFNTAYYAEKRPLYIEMLRRGEVSIKPWNEVVEILLNDMRKADAVGAFNSMFDYKRAVPFTDLYISKLYSNNYYKWEEGQKKLCYRIANETNPRKSESDFDGSIFKFRGETFPLFDLWGLAVDHLLNNATYKVKCLENGLLTASGTYFKTSAESTYQYLCNKYNFIESHTALDDAIIESYILSKVAARHAISSGIKFFPFRDLGTTDEFAMRRKIPNITECNAVYGAMNNYIQSKNDSAYVQGLIKRIKDLAEYAGIECAY